jgi:chemotaxis protein MotB
MSKKKHPEHVNHERWLVSYADFITLLFAFFVVLFASGQADQKKQRKLSIAMQTAFEHNGIFDPHSRTPPITDAETPAQNASPSAIALPVPVALDRLPPGDASGNGSQSANAATSPAKPAAEVAKDIEKVIRAEVQRHQLQAGFISVHPSPEGLVITLREAGFFASGSAEIRDSALGAFGAVAAALPNQAMRVEGHTDNIPIHTAQFATNWELSTARAATITRLLIDEHAVEPARIAATGYAEFRPAAPNATPEGRARNRRVDIVLLNRDAATPSPQAPSR